MPEKFGSSSKISAFKAAPKKEIDVFKLKTIIDDNPDLGERIRKEVLKSGAGIDIGERVAVPIKPSPPIVLPHPPIVLPTPPIPTIPLPTPPVPTPAPAPAEEEQTNFEIDTRLQLLISTIPIANPGSLITSEYHNALRDAVRGLASRIGLSVNPTAEFKILTFAPNFLPVKAKNPDVPNLTWNATLERATIPAISANDLPKAVAGGFVVQLPDSASIHSMIVRGTRAKDAPDPKAFTVALKRKKLGADEQAQTLISVDLSDAKEGGFEDKEGVKLTDRELTILDEDEGATGATVSKRRVVSNEKWMYFVSAEFFASAEMTTPEKYEINSIQIYCIV